MNEQTVYDEVMADDLDTGDYVIVHGDHFIIKEIVPFTVDDVDHYRLIGVSEDTDADVDYPVRWDDMVELWFYGDNEEVDL